MRSKIRSSGIAIIGDVPWGTHLCQFYRTEEDLMDILIPYFKTGLENNELCVWITSQFSEVKEGKETIKTAAPDIDVYLEKKQLEIIPCGNRYVTDDNFDSEKALKDLIEKIDYSLASGYDGLRLIENICWPHKEGWTDYIGYEKKADSVIDRYPVIALCTYSLDMCDAADIIEIASNHQLALIGNKGKWKQIKSSGREIFTKCRRTEQELRKSEARYQSLYENSLDAILLTRPDGAILSANPKACNFFEMTEDEIIQAGRERLVVKDEKLAASLEERSRTGRAKAELTFRRKDGSTFIGETSSSLFTDADGSTKTSMIIRDITERKRLEEETRRRAEEMETIMEIAPVPILIGHDPQGRLITGNRNANEFYEIEVGENISANIAKSRHYFYKGRELTVEELPVQRSALEDMNICDTEIDVVLPSGKRRTVTVSASPLHNAEGHVRGSVGSFIDITERKETEAKLRETLDNLEKMVKERTAELEKAYDSLKESERGLAEAQRIAHVGNWEYNIVTGKVDWSDELYRIFGLKPQEFEMIYELFLTYVHPDDRDYVDNSIKRALDGMPFSIDHRIILADEEERIVYSQGEVVFDDKNIPVRMRGTVQDITGRKKAGETLAKMEKIRIKEIHHRIKNNLQVISSLLDLQAETFSHLEVCKVPEVIKAFTESQNRVVSMALIHEELYKGDKIDALDFATYLNKLTANLFLSYNPGNENINLNLDLDRVNLGIDTAIPLGIIVNELVSNSFKHAFSAGGKGEIHISLHRAGTPALINGINGSEKDRTEKGGFEYILEISDNGKGIPEKAGIENSNSLGLQLVTILVEQLDGYMELKNENGTRFTIWFSNIKNEIQIFSP